MLSGGELLKIRGLCRNKQAQPTSSLNESSSLNFSSSSIPVDTVCDKTMYEQHTERMGNNNAIIKESPVIVTSPQHMGNASATHKPSSSSSTLTANTSGSGLVCPPDQDIPKRVRLIKINIKRQKFKKNALAMLKK